MSSYVGCWQITSSWDAPSLPCSSEGKDPHYTLYCMYVGTYVNLKHNTLIIINSYIYIYIHNSSISITAIHSIYLLLLGAPPKIWDTEMHFTSSIYE